MACVYCKKKAKLTNTQDKFAIIDNGKLAIKFIDNTNSQYYATKVETLSIPILYCPMCGEKIEL